MLFCLILSSFPIVSLSPGHIQYCRDHYANSHCEQGCDSAPCGWDGSDCFTHQSPVWAEGTLVVHTNVPLQRSSFSNSSLLWALSIILQTSLKLRGSAPLATNANLFEYKPEQLADMLAQAAPADSNGCVLWDGTGIVMRLVGNMMSSFICLHFMHILQPAWHFIHTKQYTVR